MGKGKQPARRSREVAPPAEREHSTTPVTTSAARLARLERALQESEARFHSLAEHPVSAVFILLQDRLHFVNGHCADLFGYTPGEMTGELRVTDLFVEEDQPILTEFIRRQLEGEHSRTQQLLRGVRKDGELVEVEVYGSRTEVEGAIAFMGVIVDLTGPKRAEAALREREEQLRHAQKLEAVGRLAGGIAHDFNNLLMVIQGSVNLVLMNTTEADPQRDDLQEIVRATERAAALTRQLLAFGRKQVLRPKVVNLNTAISDLHKIMHRLIGEDVELHLELDPDLGCVKVDPGQLEQVVLNLAVNSRDAMPDGGRLTIRTTNTELTNKDADRFPYKVLTGPYVCLSFEDTGFGMPESVLGRVFEPFFTTKEQGRGSGLGLSMVYGIVKQSEGYIWVASTQGQGTTIQIYLPLIPCVREESEPPPTPPLRRGSGRVLLVEDEEPVRKVTRRLLEQGGYEVVEAASGPEAIRQFDSLAGSVDLVLTDVVMPRMGGRELATRLLARNPSLPVLYMSGYAADRGLRRGMDKRDQNFIQKPFSPEELLERIQALLAA
jgi:PAS domain S-box-containing protein